MAKRLAASMHTRQNVAASIEGRLSSSSGRSDQVELAAILIGAIATACARGG